MFAHFITNELDPLWRFSDSGMHAACFDSWEHAKEFQRRYDRARRAQDARSHCALSGRPIEHWDDSVHLDDFEGADSEVLKKYSLAHIHKHALPGWDDRERVIADLEDLVRSGKWSVPAVQRLITALTI